MFHRFSACLVEVRFRFVSASAPALFLSLRAQTLSLVPSLPSLPVPPPSPPPPPLLLLVVPLLFHLLLMLLLLILFLLLRLLVLPPLRCRKRNLPSSTRVLFWVILKRLSLRRKCI